MFPTTLTSWPSLIRRARLLCVLLVLLSPAGGCFAPLHSPGIPARSLPDEFRIPMRTSGPLLNYSNLTIPAPADYLLGPNDLLEVTVPGLFETSEVQPLRALVMSSGEVQLPLVGAVNVNNMTLQQAQIAINRAYENGFLVEPKVNVILSEKSSTNIVVLGQVVLPGAHVLPKYENDVAHALAAAQGIREDAADFIEIHRQLPSLSQPLTMTRLPAPWSTEQLPSPVCSPKVGHAIPGPQIIRIPLRGPGTQAVSPDLIKLQPNDVVVVPSRRHEVFYVVGRLSRNNTARFTVGDRERELGVGFILPRDREIDVVTAVAMAGYIDPIESPTTVTVQRTLPDASRMLIRVDLLRARDNLGESVLVEPGDIIYLNPDGWWWWRRTFDRVIGELITIPYESAF